uniref:Uncharacterized protein n=1 Tax=Salinispora arenicola (strain CNS-205) TaxID=391037 RepID=A8M8E7_SALAI
MVAGPAGRCGPRVPGSASVAVPNGRVRVGSVMAAGYPMSLARALEYARGLTPPEFSA